MIPYRVKNVYIYYLVPIRSYLLVIWRVVSSPPSVGGLKIHPGCVVVDPLLSVVAESGHLNGLPLGMLVISGSILCCSITVHFSLFCVFWLVVLLTQFHHSVTTWTVHFFTVLCVLIGCTAYSVPSLCHYLDMSFWFSFEPSPEGLSIFCCFHCLRFKQTTINNTEKIKI
jgi:hypothetical protein